MFFFGFFWTYDHVDKSCISVCHAISHKSLGVCSLWVGGLYYSLCTLVLLLLLSFCLFCRPIGGVCRWPCARFRSRSIEEAPSSASPRAEPKRDCPSPMKPCRSYPGLGRYAAHELTLSITYVTHCKDISAILVFLTGIVRWGHARF